MIISLIFSIFFPIFSSQKLLCSNGVIAGESCNLVPPTGYKCTNSNSTINWCENFNGTFRCCEKSNETCVDRSEFCHFTKHLCSDKASFATMKSKCEATCGFCSIDTFADALAVRQRMVKLASQEGCNPPRKCVFPREKMLSTPATPLNTTITHKTTANLTEILSTSVTLPRGYETPRKFTIEEILKSKDSMPNITTAEPNLLTTSLKKTVIKGKCFDEYIYCQEFTSLCSHPTFSEAMALHCSLTCDRCDDVVVVENKFDENCVDRSPHCANNTDLCQKDEYSKIMKEYCPKSCEMCKPECKNRHKNCDQFKLDGFCHDEMYSTDERRYLCGRECGMC